MHSILIIPFILWAHLGQFSVAKSDWKLYSNIHSSVSSTKVIIHSSQGGQHLVYPSKHKMPCTLNGSSSLRWLLPRQKFNQEHSQNALHLFPQGSNIMSRATNLTWTKYEHICSPSNCQVIFIFHCHHLLEWSGKSRVLACLPSEHMAVFMLAKH